MVSGNGSVKLYIPEGTTRKVPYNGSSITVGNLRDTHELVPRCYNVIAGESIIDSKPTLVAVALQIGVYSCSGGIPENICEPIPESLRPVVESRMRSYLERRGQDAEIVVVPELTQI